MDLGLRHLDASDAPGYHALVRRNVAHLTRHGDYRDEVAATVDDVTARLPEPAPLRTHLMYLKRGYLPDGRGVAYAAAPVPAGAPVRVDDDLALMMTRSLGSGT